MFLCHIAVFVCRALASLDVLLVDKNLNALLDHADTRVESGFGLVDYLQEEAHKHNQAACIGDSTHSYLLSFLQYIVLQYICISCEKTRVIMLKTKLYITGIHDILLYTPIENSYFKFHCISNKSSFCEQKIHVQSWMLIG